jgi:N6-L-threonylcarbamoyladenine synthase
MLSINPMRILGIETSCDETAISLIETDGKTVQILGNTVHSQIDVHAAYGGVFPTLAKREHQKNLIPVLEKTLREAGMLINFAHAGVLENTSKVLEREPELLKSFKEIIPKIEKPDIDYISVTVGPGLEPALWVGINFARALGMVWNIPVIPCNHMEGHVLISLLKRNEEISNFSFSKFRTPSKVEGQFSIFKPIFPALSLLISGGHTQIVLVKDIGDYEIVGETRDDAVGECFDKVARTLGLPYPGGPKISKLAEEARTENIQSPEPLPRPMITSDDLDFSFSGLKTAVLYLVKKLKVKNGKLKVEEIKGIAREVEDSITDVLISKMRQAIEKFGIESLIIGGGVIANKHIRLALEKLAEETGTKLMLPQFDHATDNGLMIAIAGYFNRDKAVAASTILTATGTLPLGPRK